MALEVGLGLVGIVLKIVEVYQGYVATKNNRKELNAARILKAANILQHSLTALDNAFYLAIEDVLYFNHNFPPDKRESIKKELRRFAHLNHITPYIRSSVHELESQVSEADVDPERCRTVVRRLAEIGRQILDVKENVETDVVGSTLVSEREQDRISEMIDNVRTDQDVENLKNYAAPLYNRIHREVIAEGQEVFGSLKTCIGDEYPGAATIGDI